MRGAVIGGMGLRVAHWYTPDFELDGDAISEVYVEYALRVLGVVTRDDGASS